MNKKIVVVDYGVGNIGSIVNMLKKLGSECSISSLHHEIEYADKIILPGVGTYDSAMNKLKQLNLIESLKFVANERKLPLLGICLGMQLLGIRSEEGKMCGLSLIDGNVVKNKVINESIKIPHMGWNNIFPKIQHPILEGLDINSRFYFVHSYNFKCLDIKNVIATTFYGEEFTSIVAKDNVVGVQFHPEKSHKFGMQLLNNFIKM